MSEFISRQFDYIKSGDAVHMYADLDSFEEIHIGSFRENDNGYYEFHSGDHPLTCKMLREAAKYASNLNTGES